MSSSKNYKIRISRSAYVERDRSIAILRLNECKHLVGQPVMVRYYSNPPENTEIDTVFAIGIKDGVGENCYKVISLGGLDLVREVSDLLPDVSNLTHGELYLWQDKETSVWNYVYAIDGVRQIEPITGGPFIFSSIEDKYRWFYRDGELKREDDFVTSGEFSSSFENFSNKIEQLEEAIELLKTLVHKNYTVSFPIRINFYDEKSSAGRKYLYEYGKKWGVNFLVKVLISEVDLLSGQVSDVDITNDCEITLNGESINVTNNRYSIAGITQPTTYMLNVKYTDPDTGVIRLGTAYYTLDFGKKFYYGVIPESNWDKNVKNLDYIIANEKSIIPFNKDLNLERVALAYPKEYGDLKSIYGKNGINCLSDYSIEVISVDSIEYYLYTKDLAIKGSNVMQNFSFSLLNLGNGGGDGSIDVTTPITMADLDNLKQEILGGCSIEYNTLGKIEQKIKNISLREGLKAGKGISITQGEDGSTVVGVSTDESSISTNPEEELTIKDVDGGTY